MPVDRTLNVPIGDERVDKTEVLRMPDNLRTKDLEYQIMDEVAKAEWNNTPLADPTRSYGEAMRMREGRTTWLKNNNLRKYVESVKGRARSLTSRMDSFAVQQDGCKQRFEAARAKAANAEEAIRFAQEELEKAQQEMAEEERHRAITDREIQALREDTPHVLKLQSDAGAMLTRLEQDEYQAWYAR